MLRFPNITAIFLDEMVAFLLPLFLVAACGDREAAREAVKSLFASYNVAAEEELRLAAEITSFSFGALDALAKSMVPDLPLNAVLRLRGCANALQRSKNQCQRVLDRLRKDRLAAASKAQTPATAAERPAQQAIVANAALPSQPKPAPSRPASPHAAAPQSRQQRRMAERAAEKARCGQAEQARRNAMRATQAFALQLHAAPALPFPALAPNDRPLAA